MSLLTPGPNQLTTVTLMPAALTFGRAHWAARRIAAGNAEFGESSSFTVRHNATSCCPPCSNLRAPWDVWRVNVGISALQLATPSCPLLLPLEAKRFSCPSQPDCRTTVEIASRARRPVSPGSDFYFLVPSSITITASFVAACMALEIQPRRCLSVATVSVFGQLADFIGDYANPRPRSPRVLAQWRRSRPSGWSFGMSIDDVDDLKVSRERRQPLMRLACCLH